LPLDFFVLFSSIASLCADARLSSYAAANAFLDALAHYRQSHGLVGQSINWGAWSEVGAASQLHIDEHLKRTGVGTIPPAEGLDLLARLLASRTPQIGVAPIDWSTFGRRPLSDAMLSFLSVVAPEAHGAFAENHAAHNPSSFLQQLAAASMQDRWDLLRVYVR